MIQGNVVLSFYKIIMRSTIRYLKGFLKKDIFSLISSWRFYGADLEFGYAPIPFYSFEI